MSGGEGFLARWSRRKRGEAREGEDVAAPPEGTAAAVLPIPAPPPSPATGSVPPRPPGAVAAPSRPVAEPDFDLASLPSLDSLTPESDVRAFLARGVPMALRTAALRKVWTLDPVIRDFVGPADYAWDYNAPGGVPGFSSELPEEARRWLVRQLDGSADDAPTARQTTGSDPAPDTTVTPAPPVLAAEGPVGEADAEPDERGSANVPAPRRHGGATPA